jgi:hypothetical protein
MFRWDKNLGGYNPPQRTALQFCNDGKAAFAKLQGFGHSRITIAENAESN